MTSDLKKDSAHFRERDKKVLWHPFTQHELWEKEDFPVIVSGEGVYLFDADGKKYIDGVSSLWLNVHGHNRGEINQAISDQLDKIAHSTFLGQSHPLGIELAEKLISISPEGLTRVFFSDDGSTAMEIAIKIAYQYWEQTDHTGPARKYFIKLANAYHGDTIGSVSIGGMDLFHATYKPLLFPTITIPSTDCYRCHKPSEKINCSNGSGCLKELKKALTKGKYKNQIAGVIIEPGVQGAAGMIIQPPGFVKGVRKLCDEHNILMIADEVAVGFGRTGKMFACEQDNVSPDIMAVGKGLTGGYLPLSATITKENIFDAFRGQTHSENTFFHGHSYTANQLACAAALSSLNLFKKDQTLKNVNNRAKQTEKWLKGKISSLEHVGETRQAGLMVGIELVKDKNTKKPLTRQKR